VRWKSRVGVSAAPQIPAFIRVVWGLRVAPTLWKMEFTLSAALAGESTAADSFDQARRDEISWDKSKPWETNVEMEV
jgi:hypothetical protein